MLREMNSDTAIQLATLSSHEMNGRSWPLAVSRLPAEMTNGQLQS
jgi:hypothetical protein